MVESKYSFPWSVASAEEPTARDYGYNTRKFSPAALDTGVPSVESNAKKLTARHHSACSPRATTTSRTTPNYTHKASPSSTVKRTSLAAWSASFPLWATSRSC